ncbi:hypothetical protein, partial [Fluviicola sp.]|uniref:DUF6908 domain-containing protein n=1 Tax=Fluviicola sp. TaxID=1917219 RepID=UPI00262A54E7
MSNNSRLRSVICHHEPEITWHEATTKAQELKRTGKVNEYLDSVREDFRQTEEKESTSEPPTDSGSGNKPNLTIYQKNYDRLTLVAPGLYLKLRDFNGEYIYGKALKTGYLDFYLEVLRHEGNKFYIGISQHDKTESGKLVPAPEMEIVLDIEKKTVEALKYKDAHKDIEIYQDLQGRKFTDKNEKRSQNRFLGDWLKKLRNRGQKVKWSKKDSKEVPESFIVDEYKKNVSQETELRLVPPTEDTGKVEEKTKPEIETKGDREESELAKIIPLKAGYTEKEKQEMLERFMRVVTLNHRKNFKTIASEALSIINSGKTVPFLLDSWDKLKDRDYNHLIELNYFRLNVIVPNLLEVLAQSGGVI